jgi:hypothetical protein
MRYIKHFNENKIEPLEELEDFCESNLAYLLDELMTLYCTRDKRVTYYIQSGELKGQKVTKQIASITLFSNSKSLYWNDIKDYIIPFLQRLQPHVYKMYPNTVGHHTIKNEDYVHILYENDVKTYTLDQINSDKVRNDRNILTITIKVLIDR